MMDHGGGILIYVLQDVASVTHIISSQPANESPVRRKALVVENHQPPNR